MDKIKLFEEDPEQYLRNLIQDDQIPKDKVIDMLLSWMLEYDIRSAIRDLGHSPLQCKRCNHTGLDISEHGSHLSDDELHHFEGYKEGWYCFSCQEEMQESRCNSCDKPLNSENECPSCKQDPEY